MSDHTPDDQHPSPPEPGEIEPTPGAATATTASSAGPKIAVGLTVAIVLAAGATIFALRSASSGGVLDEHVPADVVAFGRVSLRPDADQRAAIDALLARLPEGQQTRVRESIDRMLEEAFAEEDLSWSEDVKPWIGAEIGFVVPSIGAADLLGAGPDVIGLLSVRDGAKAREALSKLTDDGGGVEVADGIAYISERPSTLTRFVDRAASDPPLADDPGYQAAVSALGRGVAFLYADGSSLAGLGNAVPVAPTGTFAVVTRITDAGVEVEGRAFGGDAADGLTPGGAPDLLEATSAELLGAISFFNLGSGIEALVDALPGIPMIRPADVLGPFNAMGLDPVNDLAPWLKGEFSVVVGGFAPGGLPQIGAVIESTDEDALDRTLEAITTNVDTLGQLLGIELQAVPTPDGFSIGSQGFGAFVVRERGKLVLASTPDYADELLSASAATLGEDAVYRATVGDAPGTIFQAFVRIDRIRDLALAFVGAEDRAEYDATLGPLVDQMQAAGIRVSAADGGSFVFRLTFNDQ